MPTSTSAWSARSASCFLTMKSRSCFVSGPPRAQIARLPPSSAGTSAPRNAATDFLSVASNSLKGSFCTAPFIPRRLISNRRERGTRTGMVVNHDGVPLAEHEGTTVRVAVAGDIHCSEANREETARAFAEIDGSVDLVLLAGDLTTHGEVEQGMVLADACRGLTTPVIAVLGNHDWHVNRVPELIEVLEHAGIQVLDRSHTIRQI